jgi:L-threonylcarbamoyladenylate synthase
VSGGLHSVGVRAPQHPVALALIRAVGEPLAAPSANAHMHVSPTTAAHVVRSLGDRVDLVLDAGPCTHGIESTVVDLVSDPPRVLRAGAAGLEAIRAIVPEVLYDAISLTGDAARASPGLAAKHYAPRTRVVLVDAGAGVAEHVMTVASASPPPRLGAIVWSEPAKLELEAAHRDGRVALASFTTLPPDAGAYAQAIFAALHDADAAGLDALFIERVPESPEWWAVADRLRRAAEA